MYAKLFGAIIAVGLVSMGLGYATFAFFSDTESSTDNVFSAGTVDLLTNGADSVTGTIGAGNFAPGDVEGPEVITLKNNGTIFDGDAEGHSVDLDINVSATYGDDTELGDFLCVNLTYAAALLLGGTGGTNCGDDHGLPSLNEVLDNSAFVDLADPLAAGKDLEITVIFHEAGGNSLQGDSVDVTLTFFLAQSGETDLA